MQPVGPYRFTEALGVCQVGTAWWAVDGQDRLVTIAVLEGAAAADQPWRESFANAASAMALTPGGQRYVNADFAAARPWVAYPAQEGMGAQRLFQTLGMELHPAESAAEVLIPATGTVAEPPQPVAGVPVSGVPVSGTPSPTSGAPLPWAMHAPVVPQQVSPGPQQVSSPPHPAYPHPVQSVSVPPYDAFTAPDRRITPSEPRPRRTGLWIGTAALVLVLVGGAGAFAWTGLGDTTNPTASPSPTGVQSGVPGWSPTAPPQQPGLEPPRPGDWPRWQNFGKGDAVRTLNPDGLGFPFVAPANWTCTLGGSTDGQVKYNCGASIGGNLEIGGELIVRNCPNCNEERRIALRKAEEAWGLQWRSGGEYVVLAETLKLNGANRYGVVVVAFWRSDPDGAIDRQLVLRMTAPVTWIDVIRRVINSVRDNARF